MSFDGTWAPTPCQTRLPHPTPAYILVEGTKPCISVHLATTTIWLGHVLLGCGSCDVVEATATVLN